MKKLGLWILLSSVLIGFSGCNNKSSWQNNTRMITDSYIECERQTLEKFNRKPSGMTMQFIGYIQQDIKFIKFSKREDKFMAKCLKNIVDNYTPTSWYDKMYKK